MRTTIELGDKAGPASAAALIKILGEGDDLVRAQASASLARLGAPAFPAMIAALTERPTALRTALHLGNNGRPPAKFDYLAYSFINSRADPGEALLRWTAKGNPRARESRLHFLAIVLGSRGERSLPQARRMLQSNDPALWKTAIDVMGRIGPAASPNADAITKRIFKAGAVANGLVDRLSSLGDVAQPYLMKILTEHPVESVRVRAAELLRDDPQFAEQELNILAKTDGQLHFELVDLLARSERLPTRAAPILLKDIEDADDSLGYRALGALTRLQHTSESAQVVREPLIRYVRKAQAEGSELDNLDLALVALAATGPGGVRDIVELVAGASNKAKLCDSLRQTSDHARIDGPEPRPEIFEGVRTAAQQACPPLPRDAPSDTDWRYESVSGVNASQFIGLLTAGAYQPSEINRACGQADRAMDGDSALRKAVVTVKWAALSEILMHCGGGSSMAFARDLFARLQSDEANAKAWAEANRWNAAPIFAVLEVLRNDKPAVKAGRPFLLQLLSWKSSQARSFAAAMLASIADEDSTAAATLVDLIDDQDESVAQLSAEAIASRGENSPHWNAAIYRLIVIGIEADVAKFLEDNIDDLRPPEFWYMSGRASRLPAFPWPPPKPASSMMFGRDVDRVLLGQPQDSLDSVQKRIVRTLAVLDPGYQSALFSVPGGFVLLTKMEQIGADGSPLPGRDRWRDVRPPPSSLSDYFVRLFLAPPGYYRTIAFMFTDRVNFTYGSGALPSFDMGGTSLPPELANARYESRNAYVLVYAYQKRDTGQPKPYTLVSAREHLLHAGLLQKLQSTR